MDKTTTSSVRLSFSQMQDKHQLAWDSTSLGALKICARYYEYNIIEGYSSRIEGVHLRFGSEYNNALVTYHKERAKGNDKETSLLAAVRYAMEHTWDYQLNRPWTSDEPTKNRETLIRSIIWYLDKYEDDPLETQVLSTGEPAVELSFRIHLEITSNLTDEPYLLCGYLDRKVEFVNDSWITDFKTTKSMLDEKYFNQYSPNNQVSQYALAGTMIGSNPIKGVIIDAAQIAVTFTRFQRAQIGRNTQQLEEWLNDAMIYIRQNETYVENNYWPMNDTSCTRYGGCPYRPVCAAIPELRPKLLEGLYHRRSWDPLVVREI
jgi:hypothetical protein